MARTKIENGIRIALTEEEETQRNLDASNRSANKVKRELEAFYDKRKSEYPTIEELVVALYDPEDKAEIDRRRAEVKSKYPKGAE